jgi:hypothetical protein
MHSPATTTTAAAGVTYSNIQMHRQVADFSHVTHRILLLMLMLLMLLLLMLLLLLHCCCCIAAVAAAAAVGVSAGVCRCMTWPPSSWAP